MALTASRCLHHKARALTSQSLLLSSSSSLQEEDAKGEDAEKEPALPEPEDSSKQHGFLILSREDSTMVSARGKGSFSTPWTTHKHPLGGWSHKGQGAPVSEGGIPELLTLIWTTGPPMAH